MLAEFVYMEGYCFQKLSNTWINGCMFIRDCTRIGLTASIYAEFL